MEIRPDRPEDWPRVCAIHDAARLVELRLSAGDAAFLTLERTAQSEGLFAGELVVAAVDGRVEGFAAYGLEELTWLYVAPVAYRRGVGRALVRHVLASVPRPVTVEVLEGNGPALSLYRSQGFMLVRRLPAGSKAMHRSRRPVWCSRIGPVESRRRASRARA